MHTKLVRTALIGAVLAIGVPTALTVATSVAGAHTSKPAKLPNNPVAGFENSTPASSAAGSTTMVVPSAGCTSLSSGIAGGVVLWDSATPPLSSINQAPAGAVLQIQCSKGSLLEYVSATAGLASFRFPVLPGDSVSLSVSQRAGTATATAADTTNGSTESASSAAPGTALLEVMGAMSASNTLPTIAGGQLAFSSSSFDGTALDVGAVPLNMAKKGTTVLTTSAASAGAFTITQP